MATPVSEKKFESDEAIKLSKPFVLRRLHSVLGLWLTLYLFEHLLVNSQAALFFIDRGEGFIRMVNQLEELPYLSLIEIIFLGLPFVIHGVWGIKYAKSAKLNAHKTDGSQPSLPQYKRNRAFSWQRITSWILLVAIILHVIHMRFINRPQIHYGPQTSHVVVVKKDVGLESVVSQLQGSMVEEKGKMRVELPSPGAAFFLTVRETFKNPLMVIAYSLFVIAACYHGFNGLWTFMIKWGVTLTRRSQKRMRHLANFLMYLTIFFGLLSAWGTYWTTLFQI